MKFKVGDRIRITQAHAEHKVGDEGMVVSTYPDRLCRENEVLVHNHDNYVEVDKAELVTFDNLMNEFKDVVDKLRLAGYIVDGTVTRTVTAKI